VHPYSTLLQRAALRGRAPTRPLGAPGAADAVDASDGGAAAAPLSVRVTFLPLLAVALDPGLFMLPAASAAARLAL
jgi:hypothetical protein